MLNILAWIVYGITTVGEGGVCDNPEPNTVGVVNEVASLPFIVPKGYELLIDSLGIEGPGPSSHKGTQVSLTVWEGEKPFINSRGIISLTSGVSSKQFTGLKIIIPEGKKVNIRLMNNTPFYWINGWYVQGELRKPKHSF